MGSRNTKLRMRDMVYSLQTRDTELWSIIKPSKKEGKIEGPRLKIVVWILSTGNTEFQSMSMYVDLYTNTYTHTQTFNRGTCAKDLKINFYFWLLIYIKEQRSEKITKILHNSTYKDIYRERRKCVGNSDVITRALDALIRSEGCESSHAAPAPRTPENDIFFDWFKFL